MKTRSMIRGLAIGAALGVAAGLLLAPASGEKTRKKIVKGTGKIKKTVKNYVQDSIGSLRDQVNEKIEQLSTKGKDVINHVSERVKA